MEEVEKRLGRPPQRGRAKNVTLRIEAALYDEARAMAAHQGDSFTAWLERVLWVHIEEGRRLFNGGKPFTDKEEK